MNRNLDGSELTRTQLIDLALASGMSPEKVTRDVKTFVFAEASRALRLEMFWRGELNLDTRPLPRPARQPLVVQWELVAALTGGRVTCAAEAEAERTNS